MQRLKKKHVERRGGKRAGAGRKKTYSYKAAPIWIRLAPAEKELVRLLAHDSGLTVSAWVRQELALFKKSCLK